MSFIYRGGDTDELGVEVRVGGGFRGWNGVGTFSGHVYGMRYIG